MTAENFSPQSVKGSIDAINEAAYTLAHPGSSPGENFIDKQIQPLQALMSAERITFDFLKEFKANPESAIYNWREIKTGIHQNNFDLPNLQLIDDVAERYEDIHGKLSPVRE